MLEQSPFTDYLIAGIVLFFAIGVLSLIAFRAAFEKQNNFSILVLLEGGLFTAWILIGLLMIGCGFYLHQPKRYA